MGPDGPGCVAAAHAALLVLDRSESAVERIRLTGARWCPAASQTLRACCCQIWAIVYEQQRSRLLQEGRPSRRARAHLGTGRLSDDAGSSHETDPAPWRRVPPGSRSSVEDGEE